jgi:Zn-finger nucleic acid-binding protein/DNA-directed RNA polymerase subunit RPC12/RpoP
MNCRNCGAPLKLIEDRNYFVCEYCATYYFPKNISPDGVTLLDDDASDVDCPVCGAALSLAAIEEMRVLYCRKCRGILARQEVFFNIVKYRRASATGPPATPRPLDPAYLQRQLNCPHCGQLMDTHPYYGPGNVAIDTCNRCAVVWLDYGEIGVITDAPGRDRGRWI